MITDPHRSHLERALEYGGGTHTLADVEALLDAGLAQAWPGVDSILVTQIDAYPQKRVLHFWLAGGNLAEIEAMLPPILAWGRAQGCTAATFTGRRGWERSFLARAGWHAPLIVMEKELSDG